MIREVQRRVSGELTLVASEQARQEMGLPTGSWGTSMRVEAHRRQRSHTRRYNGWFGVFFWSVERAVEKSPAQVRPDAGAAAVSGDVRHRAARGR